MPPSCPGVRDEPSRGGDVGASLGYISDHIGLRARLSVLAAWDLGRQLSEADWEWQMLKVSLAGFRPELFDLAEVNRKLAALGREFGA